MFTNLFVFALSLFLVIKGATLATKYASKLAKGFRLSEYTIGFIIVAVISILPETFISINSAIQGIPSFGLGLLFGSNVADLTLVFAIITLIDGRGIKIESKILKNNRIFPFFLILPLLLGLDGYFSRLEGAALIIAGSIFYYLAFKNSTRGEANSGEKEERYKSLVLLILSMAVLLLGAHFTVESGTAVAGILGVSPILIGMVVVGIGTTMPELFFSLRSVKKRDDSMAVGDILGTVLADATIVVGILALIEPFSFSPKIVYVTGAFMVAASIILLRFMGTGRILSKKETYLLFIFYLVFVVAEYLING